MVFPGRRVRRVPRDRVQGAFDRIEAQLEISGGDHLFGGPVHLADLTRPAGCTQAHSRAALVGGA